MYNKIRTYMQLQGCDILVVMEMQCVGSYEWSAVVEGFRLFKDNMLRRWRGWVVVSLRQQLVCMEPCPESDEDQAEHSRARVKEVASKADNTLDVCYKLPQQEEQVNEALDRQIEATQHLQTQVLMGNFKHPSICWRSNTAGHKQSRKFLECIEDILLLKVIENTMRRTSALPYLILPHNEGIVGNMKVKDSLLCSDSEVVVQDPEGRK